MIKDARKGPCYGCEFRKESCHTNCSEYIVWKQDMFARKQAIEEKKEKSHEAYFAHHIKKRKRK